MGGWQARETKCWPTFFGSAFLHALRARSCGVRVVDVSWLTHGVGACGRLVAICGTAHLVHPVSSSSLLFSSLELSDTQII